MNLPCCERQRCRRSRQRDWRARTVSAGNDSFIGATTIAGGTLELAAGEITAGNAESGQAILFTGDPSLRIDGLVMPTGALFGFVASDALDLADVPYDHGQNVGERVTLTAANVLQVSEGRTEYDLAFDPAQSFAGMYFHLAPDGGSGADITTNTTPCFCPGARIRTDRGEVAIEHLSIGERVLTYAGVLKPIRWIGRRSYAGRFIAGKRHILLIRITAGAWPLAFRRARCASPRCMPCSSTAC